MASLSGASRRLPLMRKPVFFHMSARDKLLAEIDKQTEPVLVETLHFMRFVAREHENSESDDILPSREVEQEVLNMIDEP